MKDVATTIKNLHTTRRDEFSDQRIDSEKIEQIKELITRTTNSSNRQVYSVLVLDGEKAKTLNFPGSHTFIFCIDFTRLHLAAKTLDKVFDSQYFMQFITATIDISLLAQTTIMAAQAMDIDTLLTNEVYHQKLDMLFTHCKLPSEYCFPLIAVCLGYKKQDKKVKKGRIPTSLIFHDNEYKPLAQQDLDALINSYDDDTKHLGLMDTWKKLGFAHYLDWFFEKWSPAIGSRKQNDEMLAELQKHKMIE